MSDSLLFAGVAAFVALYMLAATFFPVLMFIFLLKPAPAAAAGLDAEANRRLSRKIGRIAAPIIGVIALIVCVNYLFQWRADVATQARIKEEIKARQEKEAADFLEQVRFPLVSLDVSAVYRGPLVVDEARAMILNAEDKEKVKTLLREIGSALAMSDITRLKQEKTDDKNLWSVNFKEGQTDNVRIRYILNYPAGWIEIARDYFWRGKRQPFEMNEVVRITVPEAYRSRFAELDPLPLYKGGVPPPPPAPAVPPSPETPPVSSPAAGETAPLNAPPAGTESPAAAAPVSPSGAPEAGGGVPTGSDSNAQPAVPASP